MSDNPNTQSKELEKTIDFFGAASILFNIIIGSGIFYLGSLVLMYAGFSQGLAMLAWAGGGIVSMLGGLHFAELGTSIKRQGGYPVFLSEAYHPIAGYIYSVTQIFISSPAATASFALAFVTCFAPTMGLGDLVAKILAVAFILLIAVLNLLGTKMAVLINKFSLILKLLPLGLIVAAGFIAGKVQPDLSLVVEGMSSGGVATISMLLLGINATMWAYSGWQLIPTISQEMKNPEKDIPKALVLGVGAITLIYMVFNYAIYKVIPYDTLVANISGGDFYQGTVAAKELFSFGGFLVTFCIMVSVFGSFLSSMLTAARMQHTIVDSGRFFPAYGKMSKRNVPLGPIAGQVVFGSLFVLASSLQGLTILATFITCVADLLCVVAVVVMRKKYPDLERPFKVPGYKFVTPLTIIIFGAIVVNTVATNLNNVALAFIVPAIAVVMWFVFGKVNKNKSA